MAESRFSPSFIPKTPVIGTAIKKEPMGIFTLIGGLVFLASLVSVGLIFGYRKIVENQIGKMQDELVTLESQVDKAKINEIINFDRKLRATKEILDGHVGVSNFFKMLEANTVSSITFSSLRYNAPANQNLAVIMEGKAPNYRVVSEQEKAFLKNEETVSVDFKNMTVVEGKTKKEAAFSFTGMFNRKLAKYGSAGSAPKQATSTSSQ